MRISELWVYPVKSLRGVRVPEMAIASRGPALDRRYMVVDERGEFLTQRTFGRMARVPVALTDAGIRLGDGDDAFDLEQTYEDGERVRVRVWEDELSAVVHAAGSAWLSRALLRPVRLVYMPEESERQANPARAGEGHWVSFADGYPLLVLTQETLDELDRRLATPVPMQRFRPNVVVAGAPTPHHEDGWARVRLGEVQMRGVKRCERCAMTTVDPWTGERGLEPLRTLATYRREDGKVWLGMNLVHDGAGTLRVGDPVVVEESG